MGKACLIASGKGGVGKSTVAAALGQALAGNGTVCLIDGDNGLRDLDLILGVADAVVYDLLDVCEKDCELDRALIPHPQTENLYLLPAAQFARSADLARKNLKKVLRRLKERFDWVIIDAPAGIERGLRTMLQRDLDECVLICTPDDVCIRDVERTASVISSRELPRPRLIVNRLVPDLISEREMYSAKTVSETLDLELLGELPEDPCVYRALISHHTLLSCRCEAAEAVRRIARRLNGEEVALPEYGGKRRGWLSRLFHPLTEVEYD